MNQPKDEQPANQAQEQERARSQAAENAAPGLKDKEAQTSDSYGTTRESGEKPKD